MNAHSSDMSHALEKWDGFWNPPGGLININQHTASQILHHGWGYLNFAEANLLQAICNQTDPLSPAQRFWLDRLSQEHTERIMA